MTDLALDLDALDCYCDMREPREPCPVGRLKEAVERLRAQHAATLALCSQFAAEACESGEAWVPEVPIAAIRRALGVEDGAP